MKYVDGTAFLRLVTDEFDRRGWRERDSTALAITNRFLEGGRFSASSLATKAPRVFLSENKISRKDLERALVRVLAEAMR